MRFDHATEESGSTVNTINRLAGHRQRLLWEGPARGQAAAYRERLQLLQDEIDRLWDQRRTELAGSDFDH